MSMVDDLDVEDYLSWESVDYKSTTGASGVQLNVRECPNPDCGNDNWKVYLNADTGLGNCFSCGTGYNKWKFIRFHSRLDGKDLYKHITDVKQALGHTVTFKRKPVITAAVEGTLELPLSLALPTAEGQNAAYLEERGITSEYAAYFHLRYCHDAWHSYIKNDGTKGGQNFSGRIIAPIYDLDGTMVTFLGRDITGEAENKYLFPAKLPGTGRYLYNGQNAYAASADELIVGEGSFDVAAIKRVIDKYPDMKGIVPVGTFGKHLSASTDPGQDDQLTRFMRLQKVGLKRVTIMWDGEHDAFASALTAAETLWKKLGLEVWVACLPPGKDPDEATPAQVYEAWHQAIRITPLTLTKYRIRNPYPKSTKPVDELDAFSL